MDKHTNETSKSDPFLNYRHLVLENVLSLKKKDQYFVHFYDQNIQQSKNFIIDLINNSIKTYKSTNDSWTKMNDSLACAYILLKLKENIDTVLEKQMHL